MSFGEVVFVAIFSIGSIFTMSHDPDQIWTNELQIQILLEKWALIPTQMVWFGEVIYSRNVAEIQIYLWQVPLMEFQIFDCRSGISWKFGIWWYINHPIWWEVKFFKSTWIFQYFAFCGLAWPDIQILTPDLDSPENFASGEKETIQFEEGHIYQIYANILAFYGLACADIQIPTPDLDSPRNFASGGKETILFGPPTSFRLVHHNVHTHWWWAIPTKCGRCWLLFVHSHSHWFADPKQKCPGFNSTIHIKLWGKDLFTIMFWRLCWF